MAEAIARYLRLTATQPGADGFVQASAQTDILPENGLVYKITDIDVQFPASLATTAADLQLWWSITRDTKTAITDNSDNDTIISDGISVALVTSGMVGLPQTWRYSNLTGLYLVEPTVYAQLDSIGGGFAYTAQIRIFYEEVKMSEIDILRILNNT